jgi:two-component system phosphate regulon sensor histidine kinase PhoR
MALEHERHALELEAVLAAMNDALLIVDARGAIVRLNRAARELLCLDSASLVFGQPLEQQRLERWPVTAREIAAALVPVIDALRSGASHAGVEIELRSGQLRVLSLGASVLRSPKGALQGGVIVFRDITGQREFERLREDIFAMAWHDMKTPITVIRGHAELLLRRLSCGEHEPKALEADAALIVEHTDSLSKLLTTLFDVSSLEAGLLSISPRPTDLGALARDVAVGMRPAAHRHIEVLADRSIVGRWDEQRIRQVLTNLLSNALKYSSEGSTVTASLAADERSATVRVRDEGIGLDDSELAQLFRRGFRAERARKVAGAGLGLYFCNGIVTAHGGRMWAESLGHGQGSTFCFTLPLREEHSADRPVEDRA